MPEATSIPRCTVDPTGTLRLKSNTDGHGQSRSSSSSSISNSTSPHNHRSNPPSKAITPSASALYRKRRSAMSSTPSQIDTSSRTNSSNSCVEMEALSPNFSNIVSTGININRQSEHKSSMVLPFTSVRTQSFTQPRRVSMCGSSLKKARSHSPVREAPSLSLSSSSNNTFDSNTIKQFLLRRSIVALKNLSHKPGKKTKAEITVDLPDEAAAMALFQRSDGSENGHKNGIYTQPFSNTHDTIKWNIQGNDEINAWLQKRDEYIHPVESGDWNIWWGAVYNPTYAWAKFDSCEAQYDKQTRVLSLILRTFLYATGKDENGRPSCVVCID